MAREAVNHVDPSGAAPAAPSPADPFIPVIPTVSTRKCRFCGHVLSRYNSGSECFAHVELLKRARGVS